MITISWISVLIIISPIVRGELILDRQLIIDFGIALKNLEGEDVIHQSAANASILFSDVIRIFIANSDMNWHANHLFFAFVICFFVCVFHTVGPKPVVEHSFHLILRSFCSYLFCFPFADCEFELFAMFELFYVNCVLKQLASWFICFSDFALVYLLLFVLFICCSHLPPRAVNNSSFQYT